MRKKDLEEMRHKELLEFAGKNHSQLLLNLRSEFLGIKTLYELLRPEIKKGHKSMQQKADALLHAYKAASSEISRLNIIYEILKMNQENIERLPTPVRRKLRECILTVKEVKLPCAKDSRLHKSLQEILQCIETYYKKSN